MKIIRKILASLFLFSIGVGVAWICPILIVGGAVIITFSICVYWSFKELFGEF